LPFGARILTLKAVMGNVAGEIKMLRSLRLKRKLRPLIKSTFGGFIYWLSLKNLGIY
jgi:hypothetical protein